MNDPHWTRLRTLLGRVLDAPPTERPTLIDRLGDGDERLRDELRQLAGVADDADHYLGAFSTRLRDRMDRARRELEERSPPGG